jgi:hypothetical protein
VLHPEWKMLGSDGTVCKAGTKGLLSPRPVIVRAIHLVGKEGNRLEEVATGEVIDPDEVLIDYKDDEWEAVVLPTLSSVTVTDVARRAGMDRAGLSDYLRRRAPRLPPVKTRLRLAAVAATLASEGALRACALPGCTTASRRWPSITCSERHRRALQALGAV